MMELNQVETREKTICNSLQVDTKPLEPNSGDRQCSMEGDVSVTEKVGISFKNVEDTACGYPGYKEQIQTSNNVENGEEKCADKEKKLMIVENDRGSLTTRRETDSKALASTSTVKGDDLLAVSEYDAHGENNVSAPVKKDVVRTKEELAGGVMRGNEEHTNKHKTPGNEVRNNLKKKCKRNMMSAKKRMVKRVVQQKALHDRGEVTSTSEMPKQDAELRKVEEQLGANASDEVKRANKRRKKRTGEKNVAPVVAKGEWNSGGKGKEVVVIENTNKVMDTNSGSRIVKRRRRGGRKVRERIANRMVKVGNDKKKTTVGSSDDNATKKMKDGSSKENMEISTAEDTARTESTGKGKSSKESGCNGLIFMCNSKTKEDCYQYGVFGLPPSKRDMVLKVVKGTRLFLFDVELRLLYGIYNADGPGGYNIEPNAFKSNFPSQVRFTILKDSLPIPEEKFKHVIKDNYYTKNKFNFELTHEQVENLCKLFKPVGNAANHTASGKDSAPISHPPSKSQRKIVNVKHNGNPQDKKRSRAEDNVKRDKKRRRGQTGTTSRGGNIRRTNIDSRRDFPPAAALEYPPLHYAMHERQTYIPPTAHHPLSLTALPPLVGVRDLSSYTYRTTSGLVDRSLAPSYRNQEIIYADARHGYASYRDPYASMRDYQVPYSRLSEAYYHPSLLSQEGYRQSTVQSADYGVPLPPHRQY